MGILAIGGLLPLFSCAGATQRVSRSATPGRSRNAGVTLAIDGMDAVPGGTILRYSILNGSSRSIFVCQSGWELFVDRPASPQPLEPYSIRTEETVEGEVRVFDYCGGAEASLGVVESGATFHGAHWIDRVDARWLRCDQSVRVSLHHSVCGGMCAETRSISAIATIGVRCVPFADESPH